jgi:hypothetical protein
MTERSERRRIARLRAPKLRWHEDRRGVLKSMRDQFNPRPNAWTRRLLQRDEVSDAIPADINADRMKRLLDEAQDIFDTGQADVVRAEGRATTLQGVVGIAMGLSVSGAGLILNSDVLTRPAWQLTMTAGLAALLFCLGMCGFVASRASSRLLPWNRPSRTGALRRAAKSSMEADRDLAAELIFFAARNEYAHAYKLKQVEVAGRWFRAALGAFGLLAGILTLYGTLVAG